LYFRDLGGDLFTSSDLKLAVVAGVQSFKTLYQLLTVNQERTAELIRSEPNQHVDGLPTPQTKQRLYRRAIDDGALTCRQRSTDLWNPIPPTGFSCHENRLSGFSMSAHRCAAPAKPKLMIMAVINH
jgi:hypothetical protein